MRRTLPVLLALLAVALGGSARAQTVYHVAPSGSDRAAGTARAPWATVAFAASAASGVRAGDVVEVAAGVYRGRVEVEVSGQAGRPVVFRAAPGARPVLDGTGVSPDSDGLVALSNRSHVVIEGFEIRGLRSTRNDRDAIGILIDGAGAGVVIRGNVIHDIVTAAPDPARANAHGILVLAEGSAPITGLIIEGNELYDLTLGNSEALVLNCNVAGFQVLHNRIHDVDNIGIDVIGLEGGCGVAARDGVVRGNRVERASSCANPSYTDCSAAGIYIDGGRDVVVEQNWVEGSDFGIEIASENTNGQPTRGVIVRSNVLRDNGVAGLALGGYDRRRAGTDDCAVIGNTLVGNGGGRGGIAGIYVQYQVTATVLANNVVVSPAGVPVVFAETASAGLTIDHTLYDAPGGATWARAGRSYATLAAWQSATGGDAASVAAPARLADNLKPLAGSPVIDAGAVAPCPRRPDCLGTEDAAGAARVQGAAPDLGAYESAATPVASDPAPASAGLAWSAPVPNPASRSATLVLAMGTAGPVRVVLVDALGRVIAILFDGPGTNWQSVTVDVRALAPGIYTLRAVSGGAFAARRLTVAR